MIHEEDNDRTKTCKDLTMNLDEKQLQSAISWPHFLLLSLIALFHLQHLFSN
jgi:hypothetical protein